MINEEVSMHIEMARDLMEHALDHLNKELGKVRTGKASSNMVSGLMVEYYGTPTPVSQVASVSTADTRTIVIQPWEKSMLSPIEKAIFEANLGVTPQNDGTLIRLNIPPLTEERRKELVKKAHHLGEEAKMGIRNARRDAMEFIKKAVKNGHPEDDGLTKEDLVQGMTHKYTEKVDKMVEMKEKDILTI